ncbi:transposable element Tcb1 transposase [Trichonephila clavipes]|nr:transposable element Tcb1 transposase [Trichonephila clavipes]
MSCSTQLFGSTAPKLLCGSSKNIVDIAVNEAIVMFNEGMTGRIKIMKALGFKIGHFTVTSAFKANYARIKNADIKLKSYTLEARRARKMRKKAPHEHFAELEVSLIGHGSFFYVKPRTLCTVTNKAFLARFAPEKRKSTIESHLPKSGISARNPLLRLLLTETTGVYTFNGAMNGGHGQRDGMKLGLRRYRQHHDGRIRVWIQRGEKLLSCCILHSPSGSASDNMNNAHPHGTRNVQEISTHHIKFHTWPVCSPDLSANENVCSTLSQQLARDTPSVSTPDLPCQVVEAAWTSIPKTYIQDLFESVLWRVVAVIENNGGYSNY